MSTNAEVGNAEFRSLQLRPLPGAWLVVALLWGVGVASVASRPI